MSTLKNDYAFKRQDFCKEHFRLIGRDCRWFDLTGLAPMRGDCVAKITLEYGTVDHYDSLIVEIVHKTNGKIDHKQFRFADHLDARKDTRKDLPNERPYVWANNGKFDWYIAIPTEAAVSGLMGAISDYIACFEV